MTTTGVAPCRRRGKRSSRQRRGSGRRLSSTGNTSTSALAVGSARFSVNGRPSDAAEGGVTSVSLTSTDDGSVSAD